MIAMKEKKQETYLVFQKKRKQFVFDFLSGGCSGVIAKTVCAPIERVKLLMQTANVNEKLKKPYRGIIDCFAQCIKKEGFIDLWRGNGINCIRYFPTQALNFSFKEQIYSNLPKVDPKVDKKKYVFYNFLAGGTASCCTISFLYPLDLARTRVSTDIGRSSRKYKGLVDCLQYTYKQGGIRGLYQGFGIACVGLFIYRGFYFGMYDSGKQIFLGGNFDDNFLVKYIYAQFVVIFSELSSYPLDTIKRKIMLQNPKKKKFTNALDCAQKTYRDGGVKAFFTGNATNVLRSFGASLTLVLFDEFKKLSNQKFQDSD